MRFAFKPPAAPKLLPLIAAALWLCGGGALAEAPLPRPIHHWLFEHARLDGTVVKAVRGPDARLLGAARLATGKGPEALVLDGGSVSVLVTDKSSAAGLPTRDLSVEAWVMVEKPLTWGGIVGAVRDNGADETGWVLGCRDSRFSFALATTDNARLTYLTAESEFQPGHWYHVVGTYDGREHRLYVNGKLEAADRARHGDLLYPPTDTFYELGAYHDPDEHFRMTGLLHEVAVYDVALTAAQVAGRCAAKRARFPATQLRPEPFRVALGPYVQFDAPDRASIYWETAHSSPSVLEYGVGGRLDRRVRNDRAKTVHKLTLTGLEPRTEYAYRVVVGKGSQEKPGRTLSLDTAFNYTPAPLAARSPYPNDARARLFAAAAERILRETGLTKGYCPDYGCGNGQLAYELAKRSDLTVVGIDEDAAKVAEARRLLQKAGAYGTRLTLRRVPSLATLPITSCFANLIVSSEMVATGQCVGSAAEVLRVLRPGGGAACFGQPAGAPRRLAESALAEWFKPTGAKCTVARSKDGLWAKSIRGPLKGAGQWTHQYGRPDNSSYGGEALGGATGTGDLQVQWFGRPGADFGIDRNPRMPAPLAANGRLFHQGMNRIIALDAYNGAVLWTLEIPDLRRVNMPRDASNWCADRDHLYVAIRDRCWVLDAATGKRALTCALPGLPQRGSPEWGYIAAAGDKLYGTSAKRGSSFIDFWGGSAWYDGSSGPGSEKVCSDSLFACAKDTGKSAWTYRNGVILNATLAVGGGRAYFVESRNADVKALDTGRVGSEKLWLDQYLVALEAASGKKLWEQPIDTADGTVVFYLAYAKEHVVIVSSTAGKYHLYAYSAGTGQPQWQADHPWPSDNHSGHMQHPVLVGDRVFLEPCGYNLTTGKLITTKMGRREGCATYTGTDSALIYRGQNRRISMWDQQAETVSSWLNLRPSCWLSTIPAAGMVLSPEGGGGCSCGNWIETSLGFLPKQAEGETQ